jgi:hypothetical protein
VEFSLEKIHTIFYCRLVYIVIFGFGSLSIESPASVVLSLGLVLISFRQGGVESGVSASRGESQSDLLFFLFGRPL